jgi:ribosomal protein S18 acetylase RimI-like enzyme
VTRLRPLREDELGPYLGVLREAYLREIVDSGTMERVDAEKKVEADIAEQLSDGLRTPDTYLYAVEDDTGNAVGYLWWAKRPDQVGKPMAFVYDLWIHEDARGRGLGRAAMVALEDEVRRVGLDRIHLNVFGYNTPARRLYESLGYTEFSVHMGKSLPPP